MAQLTKYQALVLANAMSDALPPEKVTKVKRAIRAMPTSGWFEARKAAGEAMYDVAFAEEGHGAAN